MSAEALPSANTRGRPAGRRNQRFDDRIAMRVGARGQQLHDDRVGVAIGDDPGQAIGLGVHQPRRRVAGIEH